MAVKHPSSASRRPGSAKSSSKNGFAYSRDEFQTLIEDTLNLAKKLGASDAGAEVSEGVGLSVSVRKGKLENVERNRDKSIGVTVYLGQRRGNASTSDFSPTSLEQTVRAAYDIARFTAEDPMAGLPDVEDMAMGRAATRDLTPTPGDQPDRADTLSFPTVNAGPWGRDYHQQFERIYQPYSFGTLPELVWRLALMPALVTPQGPGRPD